MRKFILQSAKWMVLVLVCVLLYTLFFTFKTSNLKNIQYYYIDHDSMMEENKIVNQSIDITEEIDAAILEDIFNHKIVYPAFLVDLTYDICALVNPDEYYPQDYYRYIQRDDICYFSFEADEKMYHLHPDINRATSNINLIHDPLFIYIEEYSGYIKLNQTDVEQLYMLLEKYL